MKRSASWITCIALALAACGCSSKHTLAPDVPSIPQGTIVGADILGYRDNRSILVYLPVGYENRARPYPVLVVLDGMLAFGGGHTFAIQKFADSLIAVGRIPPIVVVGLFSAGGHQRYTEYVPSEGGEIFLDGVRDTLLPEVRARFRVTSDPDSTYLLGASLGGLLAADAGFTHDDTFRRVAGISCSYWAGSMIEVMRSHGRGEIDRFYQDTGDIDDNVFSDLQEVEAFARDSLGFVPGCDIKTVHAHGNHDTPAWRDRMPAILEYLLGPPGPECSSAMAARPGGHGQDQDFIQLPR
jgi:enterochelin esterase-like enzyme